MRYPGFVGPAYQGKYPAVSADDLRNWYVEKDESPNPVAPFIFRSRPGLLAKWALDDAPVRGIFDEIDQPGLPAVSGERSFAVAGNTFYQLFDDGTFTTLGNVAGPTTTPVTMASNGVQIFIASGVQGYVYDLRTGLFTVLQAPFEGSTQVAYMDGFTIVLRPDSKVFAISGLYDSTEWDGLDFAAKESTAENIRGIIVDHKTLALFGTKLTDFFWNSGNPDFPLERIPGATMENGLGAQFSVANLDNSFFWLNQDKRGKGIAYRANGYKPERISTHAIEKRWQSYPTITDAVAFDYQENGHTFWVLYFPSGDETWSYDAATNLWARWSWLDPVSGIQHAARQWCHAFAFGEHIVGDRETGTIYVQSEDYWTDDGNPIRRERTAPVLQAENARLFYHELELILAQGVGLEGDVQGNPPTYQLDISNDGGNTFPWPTITVAGGKIGEYDARVLFERLGGGRQRVHRVWTTDPNPHIMMDANIRMTT